MIAASVAERNSMIRPLLAFIITVAAFAATAEAQDGKAKGSAGKQPALPEYTILRASGPIKIDGKLDEADWAKAKSVGDFKFAWYKSGKQEQTVAKLLWNDEYLYVAYRCEDAHIFATRTKRGSDVWLDDCVEVFTAPDPDRPHDYFNIEMNVNGVCLEGHHPNGVDTDARPRWRAEGIQIAATVQGTKNDDSDTDDHWVLEAAIPLAAFRRVAKHTPPKAGDVWRLNLNRLGGKTNEQFSQWSPSSTKVPQFHAPDDFGKVTFLEMRGK
jgi:hypothetical protein